MIDLNDEPSSPLTSSYNTTSVDQDQQLILIGKVIFTDKYKSLHVMAFVILNLQIKLFQASLCFHEFVHFFCDELR
jgi:hypothetical protein